LQITVVAEDRTIVLTYHSHHVVGSAYAENDHLALAQDLPMVRALGGSFVPLGDVVARLTQPRGPTNHQSTPRLRVAITFDDGPVYDVAPLDHPGAGRQPGFLKILRDFFRTLPSDQKSAFRATSFVIASPSARRHMETSFDAQYTYLGKGSMADDWWLPALDTGLIDIANHSWDHLHPALPEVQHSGQARGDFTRVTCEEDADRQIADAARLISRKTDNRAQPYFAYPFGHYNSFLTEEYFPRADGHGIKAAFTIDATPVRPDQNIWCIPRYVCGQHWREPEALARILLG
jgi:peptidoglycan/xylan/chitin deacetylase (PgdA/CDA1 family)